MEWRDTTSYSRNKPRIATTWSVYPHPDLRITVLCDHIYYPGKWVMNCRPWYDAYPLGDDVMHATQAQEKALELVREKVSKLAAALAVK